MHCCQTMPGIPHHILLRSDTGSWGHDILNSVYECIQILLDIPIVMGGGEGGDVCSWFFLVWCYFCWPL